MSALLVTGWNQMRGKIFINYRRDDSSASAGRLYDHLSAQSEFLVARVAEARRVALSRDLQLIGA